MEIEFDPVKDASNVAKHGLSLADALRFDLLVATVVVDQRDDYGEVRYRAFQRLDGEGYCLAFAVRGEVVRPISLRRAHDKEMRRHGW